MRAGAKLRWRDSWSWRGRARDKTREKRRETRKEKREKVCILKNIPQVRGPLSTPPMLISK